MKINTNKNKITTDITSNIKLVFNSKTSILEIISISDGVLKTKKLIEPVTVSDFISEVNNVREIFGVK